MVQPTTWLLLALALLAGSRAAAQLQPPVRQRQDRSATLPAPPAEPLLELYMAADSSTTVVFDGGLDRDTLTGLMSKRKGSKPGAARLPRKVRAEPVRRWP